MPDLHKKMYAAVVGGVDDTLAYIGELLARETCGKEELTEVGMRLKAALLQAEDMYIESGEE